MRERDREAQLKAQANQAAAGLAEDIGSTQYGVEYNQVDQLRMEIEKLGYVIKEQERELLNTYRKLSNYI